MTNLTAQSEGWWWGLTIAWILVLILEIAVGGSFLGVAYAESAGVAACLVGHSLINRESLEKHHVLVGFGTLALSGGLFFTYL